MGEMYTAAVSVQQDYQLGIGCLFPIQSMQNFDRMCCPTQMSQKRKLLHEDGVRLLERHWRPVGISCSVPNILNTTCSVIKYPSSALLCEHVFTSHKPFVHAYPF